MKEISCLYEIRRTVGLELSLEHVCHHIFRHLIAAMRFPEIATAVIELDDRRYTSENHAHGLTHELRSNITVNKRLCGQLWVFYPEDKPFLLPEEQRLVDAVARDLERWLEGKSMEQTLVSIAETTSIRSGGNYTIILGSRSQRSVTRPRPWNKTCRFPVTRKPRKLLRPSPGKRRAQSDDARNWPRACFHLNWKPMAW